MDVSDEKYNNYERTEKWREERERRIQRECERQQSRACRLEEKMMDGKGGGLGVW